MYRSSFPHTYLVSQLSQVIGHLFLSLFVVDQRLQVLLLKLVPEVLLHLQRKTETLSIHYSVNALHVEAA